jgi:hypothetical protein
MKLHLTLLSALLLTACATTPAEPEMENGTGRPLSKEGEFCGGIAAFQCEQGLTCVYEGNYPDAGGTCVRQ